MTLNEEVAAMPLEDLELSPRASDALIGLGVATVGELMARAPIELRVKGPPKMTGLVVAELLACFAELGVEAGELFALPPAEDVPLQRAEGSVAERWATIRGWLEAKQPAALDLFRPAASAEQVATAEAKLGKKLPPHYVELVTLFDGQEEPATITPMHRLYSLEEVVEHGPFVGDDAPEWLAIGVSARGRDILCLDESTRVVEYIVDDDARPVIAPNVADLLSQFFTEVQTGEIDLENSEDEEDHD